LTPLLSSTTDHLADGEEITKRSSTEVFSAWA
jgi:hypothetical protein